MLKAIKILLVIIYSAIAIPAWVASIFLTLGVSFVIACALGGVKLFIECVKEVECMIIFCLVIFLPLILVGGIFWYFFDNIDITCDIMSSISGGLVVPVEAIMEACD